MTNGDCVYCGDDVRAHANVQSPEPTHAVGQLISIKTKYTRNGNQLSGSLCHRGGPEPAFTPQRCNHGNKTVGFLSPCPHRDASNFCVWLHGVTQSSRRGLPLCPWGIRTVVLGTSQAAHLSPSLPPPTQVQQRSAEFPPSARLPLLL